MSERLEVILKELRSLGGRVTTARRVVVEVLVNSPSHVTAEEISDHVQTSYPQIHLSTVYRTLEALEKLGIVDHVHLGHGRAVYHLADDPHQHLVCEQCGNVLEVPYEVFADLEAELLDSYDFKIRSHHFAVLGRCSNCREIFI